SSRACRGIPVTVRMHWYKAPVLPGTSERAGVPIAGILRFKEILRLHPAHKNHMCGVTLRMTSVVREWGQLSFTGKHSRLFMALRFSSDNNFLPDAERPLGIPTETMRMR